MVDKFERVLFGKDGEIARITLNRPEVRNCVDRQIQRRFEADARQQREGGSPWTSS
jgi:enoyl-CoA hydratase/carnithine racemase